MSTSTTDLGTVLSAAIQGGYVAHLAPATYTITEPIVIHVTSTTQGPLGLDGGGATLISQVASGQPVIQFVVEAGVDLRYLQLSNFMIQGSGQEGAGISILAPSNDSWVYNWTVRDVTVEGVGGYGLDIEGSVFEGTICDSWMIDNSEGGARFAHSPWGGATSALRWMGGGLEDNGGPGVMLANGARDISVEGASFAGNEGAGISAEWGITSVCSSAFVDNQGAGIWFQNFGSFNDNDFSSSGTQSVGITGYLAGNATLIGNESTWTGSGPPDTTVLANVQGNGGLFLCGDDRSVVTGSNVLVSGEGGGNLASVTVAAQGVALPVLEDVSQSMVAAKASSAGPDVVENALRAAIADNTLAQLSGQNSYTITAPIIINITSSSQAQTGIDLGGAKLYSQIAGGGPVIEIIVVPGVEVGNLTLSNFSIFGNGSEAAGVRIVANGADRSVNLNVSHVNIEHVGGIGLDILGNVRGTVFDSWMHGNDQGGARFAGTAGGGMPADLEWIGGGFRKNGGAGLILDDGVHDMTVRGAYFVENEGPGLYASSGITLVRNNGFENNQGVGAVVQGSGSFVDNTFSTWGAQQVGIGGYLAGGTLTLIADSNEYYGGGADTTKLANVQGHGTLGIAGGGNVVVGAGVVVTGASLVGTPTDIDPPSPEIVEGNGSTILLLDHDRYVFADGGGASGPALKYLGATVAAGQFGDWMPIAVEAAADGGYDVVWKTAGADQYTAWHTDSGGNYVSSLTGIALGSDYALQVLEHTLAQDLNEDGTTGFPTRVIETSGSTDLLAGADRHFLGDASGPSLKYLGADIVTGQFGNWTPIAVEALGGGFAVAWKQAGADQYVVWRTDDDGHYTASLSDVVSGTTHALQDLEDIFAQDLNGDGTTGLATSRIETDGSTNLLAVADRFVVEDGPSLKYLGADVVAGQFGDWTPIAVEAAAGGGYDLVWKAAAADQYTAWHIDGSGNYASSLTGIVSGSTYALQDLEDILAQDLSRDGTVGITTSTIETSGSTDLVTGADRYFFGDTSGPMLSYLGTVVVAGQFGDWTPIAVEAAGGGYDIVWRSTSADQYTAWHTDGRGDYAASLTGIVSGADPALVALETSFDQDLNGNGFIG